MATSNDLTSKQVAAGFGISTMCLANWRKGNAATGRAPLPFVESQRGALGTSIRFKLVKVEAWAKRYNKPFTAALALAAASNSKPGPKVADKPAPMKRSATAPIKPKATKKADKPKKAAVSPAA